MKIKRLNRFFTLIEVLIAVALLTLAAGLIGWKTHVAMQRKRFFSTMDRLQARCLTCQKLACTMKADWQGILQKKGEEWSFETHCLEGGKIQELPPLSLSSFSLLVEEKPTDSLIFIFFSTGQIYPQGTILFVGPPPLQREWKVPQLFQRAEKQKNKELGPIHPDEF